MNESEQATEIRRLLGLQSKKASPFAVLNLDIEVCKIEDVNRAYRRIALSLHPDKCKLPYAADAFYVAERAHKLLAQEAVLTHLKRAHMRQKELNAETASSVPRGTVEQNLSPFSSPSLSKIRFGSLSKLAPSEISTDAQKASEIERLLQCKAMDYFIILDLDPEQCEVNDVNRRYRHMAQALHPDKCQLPRVSEAFSLFEKAHKELSDERRLRRFKMSFIQQQKREAELREMALKSGGPRQEQQRAPESSSNGLTSEERFESRKREALREQQLEAMRLGDEAARKRKRMEEKETEARELAVELERQRKEWKKLKLF